jgi:DNA repair protein RadC
MSIAVWPISERPREKLLDKGAAALSDAELLAIFLRTGVRGSTAVDLARELIHVFGSLSHLLRADLASFCAVPGLGPAKYVQLMAASELCRRALQEELESADALDSPDRVRDFLRLTIGHRDIEIFMVILLSVRNHVLSVQEIFRGTLTETRVYPREILRQALLQNAAAVIVAHNHPSGTAEPSAEDRRLTEVLKKSLQMVDISLLDHFVVTSRQAVSFAERGWL